MNDDIETELHNAEVGRTGKPDEVDANLATILLARAFEFVPFARANIRVHGGFDYSRGNGRKRSHQQTSGIRPLCPGNCVKRLFTGNADIGS